MKVKFDADSLKELCLNHTEKVLFVVFVCYVLSIFWSSMGIRGFEKTPENLQSLVRTANENLQKDETKTPPIDDYRTLIEQASKPVSEDALKMEVTWNPVLFSELKKREQPKTLKIENLQVTFTRGQVKDGSSKDEDDDSGLVRTRACVVTGVIPYREQEKAFRSVLANSDSSQKRAADEPTYYMYGVERAEVPADGDMSQLKWTPIPLTKGQNFNITKSFSNASVTDTIYSPPTLMNYPPKDKEKKDQQDSGSASAGQDSRGLVAWRSMALVNPLPPWCGGKGEGADEVQINYPKAIDMTQVSVGTTKSTKAAPKAAVKETEDTDADDEEGESDAEATDNAAAAAAESSSEKKAPVRLFQFVDYTVKPGKRYTYRVRIQLHNPNYNYKPTYYVAKEEYTKEKFLPWSEWSDPSPVVETTRDERFMLSNTVVFEENKKKMPFLSLMLIKFEEKTGKEITPNFSFIPCIPTALESVSVSRKDKGKELKQPLGAGQYLLLTEVANATTESDDAEAKPARKTYDTHFFLLDTMVSTDELYSKGKTLKKEERKALGGDDDVIYPPTRALLMDPDGNIAIHSEVVDMEWVYPQLSEKKSGDSLLKPADEGKKRERGSRRGKKRDSEEEGKSAGKKAATSGSEDSALQSSSDQKSSGRGRGHRNSGRNK